MAAVLDQPEPARQPARADTSGRPSSASGVNETWRIIERTKSVAIGVLALGVGILLCAQVAKPSRPSTPDAKSITLAPRAPM